MALDPNKKFLYFNADATLTEMDSSLCFPVTSFIGVETQTDGIIDFYFEGSKGTDATLVKLVQDLTTIKAILISLVDEINYGEKAFIKVYDRGQRGTYPSDVSFAFSDAAPPTFTLQDADFDVVSRRYDITSTADGDYQGDVVYFGGEEHTIAAGEIVHYKSNGNWEKADANAVATSDGLLGIALGADASVDGVLLRGMVTIKDIDGTEAVGMPLYLSEDATGHANMEAPAGNNDIVRVIGYCLHASSGMIWFNPDNTFVEVTA